MKLEETTITGLDSELSFDVTGYVYAPSVGIFTPIDGLPVDAQERLMEVQKKAEELHAQEVALFAEAEEILKPFKGMCDGICEGR